MSEPKRHHYVPQFYLRFFARGKMLHGKRPDGSSFCTSVKSVCFAWHENTLLTQGANPDVRIEEHYGRIETAVCNAMVASQRNPVLTDDHWSLLREFVALQLARSRERVDARNQEGRDYLERLREAGRTVVGKGASPGRDAVAERFFARMLLGLHDDDAAILPAAENVGRLFSLRDIDAYLVELESFNHCLIALDGDLITCDQPVSAVAFSGPGGEYLEIFVPLTRSRALLLVRAGIPAYLDAPAAACEKLNERTAWSARAYTLGHPDGLDFPAPLDRAVHDAFPLMPAALMAPGADAPVDIDQGFAAAFLDHDVRPIIAALTGGSGTRLTYVARTTMSGAVDVVVGDTAPSPLAHPDRPGGDFAWGYGGSGPLALAMAVLRDLAGRAGLPACAFDVAKHDFVTWYVEPQPQQRRWRADAEDIVRWLCARHARSARLLREALGMP